MNSVVLQADLPGPAALSSIHTANYTVCCKTTPAAVCRGNRKKGTGKFTLGARCGEINISYVTVCIVVNRDWSDDNSLR